MNARGSEGFYPSSTQPPSLTRGEGGVGRPEAQNERRNTGASQKTALVRPQTPGIPRSLVGAAARRLALRVSGSGVAALRGQSESRICGISVMPHRALRSSPTNDATDLTDELWAALAPLVITLSSNGRRPTDIDRRAIVNALRSNHRTGCKWRMLPADFPPMSSVRSYWLRLRNPSACIGPAHAEVQRRGDTYILSVKGRPVACYPCPSVGYSSAHAAGRPRSHDSTPWPRRGFQALSAGFRPPSPHAGRTPAPHSSS